MITNYKLMSQEMLDLDVKLASEQLQEQAQAQPVRGDLPESATIYCTYVKDQGTLGACTAFATCAAIEAKLLYKTGHQVDLSELCLYHLAKEKDPWDGVNYSGSSAVSACTQAKDIGCCHELAKPYKNSEWEPLTTEQRSDASVRRISKMQVLNLNADIVKGHLRDANPVVFSLQMYENYYKPLGGYVKELGKKLSGGHAVLCCGYFKAYNDTYYIIKNSWGEKYGNQGFFYLSETDLFENSALQVAIAVIDVIPNFCATYPAKAGDDVLPDPEPEKPKPLEIEPEKNVLLVIIKRIITIILNAFNKN